MRIVLQTKAFGGVGTFSRKGSDPPEGRRRHLSPGKVPLYNFRKGSDEQIDEVMTSLKQEDSAEVEEESFLYCKHCNFIITSPSHRIEIAGTHSHTFRNPAGIVFRIGCFSSAKGCFHFGEPTAEHSWFPGYSWSFANCLNCFQHMGWLFQSGDSHFYGLILNNLVSKR